MSIIKAALVIGLTGAFGSGCTTFGKALKEMGFEYYRLSDIVRDKWLEANPGKSIEEAPRSDLQTVGNELRERNGLDFLAVETVKKAKGPKRIKKAVIDSIRNIAEVKFFRDSYPNFFLIAVDASKQNRKDRVLTKQYNELGLPVSYFDRDDARDKNEEDCPFGQQVRLCVDDADILIGNDEDYHTEDVAIRKFIENTKGPYIDLLSGEAPRRPQPDESYMSIAYSASLLSKCIKRQVGAVLVDNNSLLDNKDTDHVVISIGYNANPRGKKSCMELYSKCFRDIYKQKLFDALSHQPCPNPSCERKELGELTASYRCPDCGFDLDKFYVRDKALARCTALHAEEKAILNADPRKVYGSTLYVTTFPCFMCSHKIMDAGIKEIIYCEPYPDPDSARALKDYKKIHVERFEGVKSRAYFRLFGSWRKNMEAKLL